MPAGLRRYYGKGHLHFVTFSCYRRLPLLKTVRAREIFVAELGKVRDEMGFHLLGYVVMPGHVHLLMSEPKRGTPSTVLQRLKLRVARKLRKRRKRVNAEQMQLPFGGYGGTAAGVLASTVLRFQCVQSWEENREVELHARKSGDSRVSETSERLGMEQLGFLLRKRRWTAGDR